MLRAYELVPESHRQRIRNSDRTADQTFIKFAGEKSLLFDKWCQACTLEEIRELILVEQLKKCLPDRIVIYLNEKKYNH